MNWNFISCKKLHHFGFPTSVRMALRCSAKQIADFVVLWGMTGTSPSYCRNAENARDLKSLDLILSTVDIFVEAFCFSFEEIYRKYKVTLPLSEETFVKFLKPRCFLLTKDNKCFNFMLVCAFVFEMIFSFSHYNKCLHLIKVASKCLATSLTHSFKRIFETDSGWKELISFCIKMHTLVYPSDKNCESDNNPLGRTLDKSAKKEEDKTEIGSTILVDNKIDASFPNLTRGVAESSIKNYGHDGDSKNDEEWERKDSDKKVLTTKKNRELGEGLCKSKASISTEALPMSQLKREVSALKSKDKGKIVDVSKAREKDCAKADLELSNMFIEQMALKNYKSDLGQMIKKNTTLSPDKELFTKTVTSFSEDLCNSEIDSKDAFQREGESSPKEESDDVGDFVAENKAKVNDKDLTDSSFSNLTKEIIINDNNEEPAEKLRQKNECNRNATLSLGDSLDTKKVTESLDLCTLEPTSTDALQPKCDSFSTNDEFKHAVNTIDENNPEADNEKNGSAGMTDLSLPYLERENIEIAINDEKKGTEKLGQLISRRKHLTLSLNSAVRKEPKTFVGSGTASSMNASHTLQMKNGFTSSLKELQNREVVFDESKTRACSNKDYVTDSLQSELTYALTRESKTIDTDADASEKRGQMMRSRKKLTLSLRKDSDADDDGKGLKDSTPFRAKESLSKDGSFNILRMPSDEVRLRIAENPRHLSEVMKLLEKCEGDLEPNLFCSDECDILKSDSDEEDLEAEKSCSSCDLTIFELSIKAIVLAKNMKLDLSIKRIFCEDNMSDDDSLPKAFGAESSGDEVAFGNRIFTSADPRCPSCAGKMNKIFDDFVNKFCLKYSDIKFVTDVYDLGLYANYD